MGAHHYFIGFLAILALSSPAAAGELTVVVRDGKGAPVSDAVVTIAAAAAANDQHTAETVTVDQKGEVFLTAVSLIRPGDSVRFKNSDPVLHHVYSFAQIHPFDMLVRSGDTTDATLYETAGLAAIGCNVHDDMLTYVYVADTPFAAKTGEDGGAKILGLPGGATQITVWHPRMKSRSQTKTFAVTIGADDPALDLAIELKPVRRRGPSRY